MGKTAPMAAMKNPDGVDYQTEEDVRTLHRANQIKKDSKRHKAAKAHAKKLAAQHMAIAKGDVGAGGGAPDTPSGEPDQDD